MSDVTSPIVTVFTLFMVCSGRETPTIMHYQTPARCEAQLVSAQNFLRALGRQCEMQCIETVVPRMSMGRQGTTSEPTDPIRRR